MAQPSDLCCVSLSYRRTSQNKGMNCTETGPYTYNLVIIFLGEFGFLAYPSISYVCMYVCMYVCIYLWLRWVPGLSVHSLFIHLFVYLFIYLFLAALGLRCCARAFSSCGERGLLIVAVRGLLIVVASLVVEHGL